MTDTGSRTRTDRVLGGIERVGNKIPEPFVLFVGLFAVLAVISTGMALAGVQAQVEGADEPTVVRGLFTVEGLRWLTTTLVDNFVGFPPLGTVVVILLAVGIAQSSGLLSTLIKRSFSGWPSWALPYAVALVGTIGSVMADSVMIVLPPLAAMVFAAAGRHPVAGLLGAFAAAGAGYSTSMVVTSLDALFAGITSAVTGSLPDPGTPVTPVSNWYFNIASSLVLTVVCGLLITRVLEPRLQRLGVPRHQSESDDGDTLGAVEDVDDLTVDDTARRGLRLAGIAALLTAVALLLLTLPPGAPLRNEDGGYLPESPLLDSVVFIVVAMLAVPGLVYGRVTGTFRRVRDVPRAMADAVKDMSSFIVLAFVLGQFIALFNWSGVGTWLAVTGAAGLTALDFTGFGAILAFVLLCSLLNLFIVSGSSMWTIMGAVFVPLFALVGYEPGFTQAAFRIGDSATQILTPLNPYLVIVLAMLRRYEPSAGFGTLISRFLPFTVCFWLAWAGVLAVWFFLDLPFGPGQYARL
ncbi:aminobenzoyl-glutamate transport protein [Geodermatophilus pulveris]|uniref:Aminobenzoyl-glutamate transport protein n=1 Tax=Geodermatophilus pulveris TaxID=1564159 RepID=A0A239C8X7_9ACTN|nr:AbgT family transporter [Geodermatophilus pulveris]SNS16695.1 aminobenzoyl-glutamate transport protein [Geodermatophilus pulveris]